MPRTKQGNKPEVKPVNSALFLVAGRWQTLKRTLRQMTFDHLYDLIEDSKKAVDSRTKLAVERLIQAETDWRIEVKSLEDFINLIENEVNGESTKENVRKRLIKFELNIAVNAWEAESFTSLMEVFEYNESKTLKEIFEEIIIELKN